mmetsp:Transcript_2667/g.4000  ORF Transcript_2667/g.4000 Transcript_2667/m.4000 type:complete len:95 (+) Transcript_2667:345-629(+)
MKCVGVAAPHGLLYITSLPHSSLRPHCAIPHHTDNARVWNKHSMEWARTHTKIKGSQVSLTVLFAGKSNLFWLELSDGIECFAPIKPQFEPEQF